MRDCIKAHGIKSHYWAMLLFSLAIAACNKPPPELKIHPDERFPDLTVRDLKNHPKTLNLATGKLTILNVWATWCGPCRHEMPSLDRLSELLDEEKFQVIGLSVDEDDHLVREFLIDRKIYFENYLDHNMLNAESRIGVRVFPSTFFIGPDGKLLKVVEGWRYWDTLESINEIKSLAVTLTP
jgi:thiol-disulfide isomerase/thioredoxin